MSDLGWNIWGVVAAVLGLLIPIGVACFIANLPTARLPALLSLMKETQDLFATALRDGLITDEKEFYEFNANLWAASIRVDEVRAKVYSTRSRGENIVNWWQGLSRKITLIYVDVNRTRVKLVKRNSNERKKLASDCSPGDLPVPTIHEGPYTMPLPPSYRRAQSMSFPSIDSASLREPSSRCFACGRRNSLRTEPMVHAAHDIAKQDVESSGFAVPPAGDVAEPTHHADDHASATARPTHHLVSDADLQGLLAFALSHPLLHADESEKNTAMYNNALLHLGAQLYGTSQLPPPAITHARRHIQCTHLGTLAQLLRCVYGVQPTDVGGDAHKAEVDPESQLPLHDRCSHSEEVECDGE